MNTYEIYQSRVKINALDMVKNNILKYFSECEKPDGDIYSLSIEDDEIAIEFMGFIVKAMPRAVRFLDSSFGLEYKFVADTSDASTIEVSRFYLLENGKLYSDPSRECEIGDYDSVRIIKSLLQGIVADILQSELYLPSPLPTQA